MKIYSSAVQAALIAPNKLKTHAECVISHSPAAIKISIKRRFNQANPSLRGWFLINESHLRSKNNLWLLERLLPALKGWSRVGNSIFSSTSSQSNLISDRKLVAAVEYGGAWANSQLRDGGGEECVNLREWISCSSSRHRRGWWAIMTGWGGCLIPGALERLHAAAGTLISAAFALQWRQRVSRGNAPLYSLRHTGRERPIKLRNEQHPTWSAAPGSSQFYSIVARFLNQLVEK